MFSNVTLFIMMNFIVLVFIISYDFLINTRKYQKKVHMIFLALWWKSRFERFLLYGTRVSTSIFVYLTMFCGLPFLIVLCVYSEWKPMRSEFFEDNSLSDIIISSQSLELENEVDEDAFLHDLLLVYVDSLVEIHGEISNENDIVTVNINGKVFQLYEKREQDSNNVNDNSGGRTPFCVEENTVDDMITTKAWLRVFNRSIIIMNDEEAPKMEYYFECRKTTSYTIISRLVIPLLLILFYVSLIDFVKKIVIPFHWAHVVNHNQLEKLLLVIIPFLDPREVQDETTLFNTSMFVYKTLETDFKENTRYKDEYFQVTDNWMLFRSPRSKRYQICYIGFGLSAMSRPCHMIVYFKKQNYVSEKWKAEKKRREGEEMLRRRRAASGTGNRRPKNREMKIWVGIVDQFSGTSIFADDGPTDDLGYDLSLKKRKGIVAFLWRTNYPFRWYCCRARGILTREEREAREAARRHREALARMEKEREEEVETLKSVAKSVLDDLLNQAGSTRNRERIYYHGECLICGELDIHVSFQCGRSNKLKEEEDTKVVKMKCRGILCRNCAIRTCELKNLACPFCRTPIDLESMILVRKDSEISPLEEVDGMELDEYREKKE